MLTLDSPPVLATNVAGNRVQNALVSVHTSDLPLLFELQKEVDGMGLDLSERHAMQEMSRSTSEG